MNERLEAIRAQLARINDLTSAELDALKTEIGDVFDEADALETTPENVAICQELAAAITVTMERTEAIAQAQAQAESDKEAARQVRASLNGEPDDKDGEGDGGAPTEDDADDDDDANVDDKEKVLTASRYRSSPSRMNGRTPAPRINPERQRASLVAAGPLPGKASGSAFTNRWELAEVMTRQLQSMHKKQSHGRVVVASADFAELYPTERRLIKGDNVGNAEKFDAVTGLQALVASGGTCLPVNVDYSLDTWATADRPLKAGLAQFQAERGGLTFRQPPTVAALAGATSIWTEATDADPGESTKPVLAIACASPETVLVDAVPTRLQFGNLQGQFDPDTIAANTDLAIAAAGRVAETNLLTHLQAAMVADITSAHVLGASRDWFTTIDLLTANFRYTHRLPETQMLTIVLPAWVKNMIRADRAMELAHDAQAYDVFGVPDAWVDDMLSVRGIKAIWMLDALPVNGSVYPSQQFTGFTASSPIPSWPTKVVWFIYIEGSIQFLDSGLLNLGVVRDATLDSTNDYETFLETFEGLAFRGFSGGGLEVVSTLSPCGGSAATVAVC